MANFQIGLAVGSFIALTIIYFVIQYMITDEDSTLIFMIYYITLVILQLLINIWMTTSLCGEVQARSAFLYTILPWVLIFGMLYLMLLIFPGWLRPFSNTFGYLAISNGLKNLMGNIIISKEETPKSNTELNQTLGKIYDDPSLLINEISNPGTGLDIFLSKLTAGGLLSPRVDKKDINDLTNKIKIKFAISKCIWFLLTGLLTISTSQNYIIKSACQSSVKEMEQRHKDYEKLVAEKVKTVNNNERIYTDTGH